MIYFAIAIYQIVNCLIIMCKTLLNLIMVSYDSHFWWFMLVSMLCLFISLTNV